MKGTSKLPFIIRLLAADAEVEIALRAVAARANFKARRMTSPLFSTRG